MIENLIEKGAALQPKSSEGVMGITTTAFAGEEFEQWASEVALCFQNQSDSAVKSRVLQKYGDLKKNSTNEFHEIALGALKALASNE